VLVVSLGSTVGLRTADRQLASAIEQAGVRVALVWAAPQRQVRTYALTDLVWALAARRAAARGLAVHRPRAVLYSSVTAALLWPRPGAIRFDALAGANRPGRHGIWQRPLERRRLAQAPLLVPASEGAMSECARACDAERVRTIVLPIPVEPSGPAAGRRDIAAITYAGNPAKKGLDRVLYAWSRARREGEQLVVAGVEEEEALAGAPPGVTVVGRLAPEAYRTLLRRSRVFVTAPRREDYGAAQLEALADGCQLVTTVAPGPYAALPLARELDPRLVGADLASSLRIALDDPRPGYAERAAAALWPYREAAFRAAVADHLVPRLLAHAPAPAWAQGPEHGSAPPPTGPVAPPAT